MLFSASFHSAGHASHGTSSKRSSKKKFEVPDFCTEIRSEQQREVPRKMKYPYRFKYAQLKRLERLAKKCAQTIGVEATIDAFGKLRHENSLEKYNLLTKISVEKDRESDNEDVALECIRRALQPMKKQEFRSISYVYN